MLRVFDFFINFFSHSPVAMLRRAWADRLLVTERVVDINGVMVIVIINVAVIVVRSIHLFEIAVINNC